MLPDGWDNLTSVDFASNNSTVGIDNVDVELNEPTQFSIDSGYIKLDTSNGTAPPNSHCNVDAHDGRMFVDSASDTLYLCTQSGWTATQLGLIP